jgi:Pyruvate/2-oxoacid:ferredoxin oxidoreductase gamma subunit
VGIPATKIAGFLGSTRAANMVMLGALIAETAIVKKSSLDKLFARTHASGNKGADLNNASILEGMKYLENKKSCYC